MATFDELLDANKDYAKSFDQEDLPAPPARRVAMVTCMDARIHPENALGIELGGAHMIRNAGGRVSDDAIRSLVISQRLLGTNEVIVMHHTDCGMMSFENEDLAAKIQEDLGVGRFRAELPDFFRPGAKRQGTMSRPSKAQNLSLKT